MYSAFRAKTIISLAGEQPATGLAALDAPLRVHSDAVIVARNGKVEAVESYAAFCKNGRKNVSASKSTQDGRSKKEHPREGAGDTESLGQENRLVPHDLGDVVLVPGLINAHCHLELSHLEGATILGQGFVPWLQSLIPLTAQPVAPDVLRRFLAQAVTALCQSGVAHVGDVGSRNPTLVAETMRSIVLCPPSGPVDQAEGKTKATASVREKTDALAGGTHPALYCEATHFLEAFGFGPPLPGHAVPGQLAAQGYCPSVAATLPPERYAHAAVAGHALYSTSPAALAAAHAWCTANKRPFSMHLAEHAEEEACLRFAQGPLFELLAARILPVGWRAPGLSPAALAASLGLLSPCTLAVHCVRCTSADIALLRGHGSFVCLCPRSNAAIGVGTAPAREMALAGVPLCLGTDSLASNHNLDMQEEMLAAKATWNFSSRAVLRMATVNGAAALQLTKPAQCPATLAPGTPLAFAVLRPELAEGLT